MLVQRNIFKPRKSQRLGDRPFIDLRRRSATSPQSAGSVSPTAVGPKPSTLERTHRHPPPPPRDPLTLRKLDVWDELDQQVANAGVEVSHDGERGRLVMSSRVGDWPVDVLHAGHVENSSPQPRVMAMSLAATVSRVSSSGASVDGRGRGSAVRRRPRSGCDPGLGAGRQRDDSASCVVRCQHPTDHRASAVAHAREADLRGVVGAVGMGMIPAAMQGLAAGSARFER